MVAFQLEKLDALRRQVKSAMMYPTLVFAFAMIVDDRRRRLHRPGLRRASSRNLASENPDSSSALPLPTQITVSDLRHRDRLLVHRPSRAGRPGFAFFRAGRRPSGAVPVGRDQAEAADQDRRRRPEGRHRPLVADLLGNDRRRRADPAGGQDRRRDRRQRGHRARDGGRLRLGPPRRDHRRPARGRARSSRRWSPTWSPSARRRDSSSRCSSKIADFYEAEVDAKVKALTSLIEPIMIIVVGGVVGFIVISMYLPIFSLYDKIR